MMIDKKLMKAILTIIKGARPRMQGTYIRDGKLYATDGYIAIVYDGGFEANHLFISEQNLKDGNFGGIETEDYPPIWELDISNIQDTPPKIETLEKLIKVVKLLTKERHINVADKALTVGKVTILWC